MSIIYGDVDRRICTGVNINDVHGVSGNHLKMASMINSYPVDCVQSLTYVQKLGVPLQKTRMINVGKKHFYTCIMIQGMKHTLFSYESFEYIDYNHTQHVFSRFLPPNSTDIIDFLNDEIIY